MLGGGLLAAAAVVAFYSVYFVFTTIAEGIRPSGSPLAELPHRHRAHAARRRGAGAARCPQDEDDRADPEKTIENAQKTVAGIKAAIASPGTVTPAPRPVYPAARGQAAERSQPPALPDPSRDA